jgi:hypothetical protein
MQAIRVTPKASSALDSPVSRKDLLSSSSSSSLASKKLDVISHAVTLTSHDDESNSDNKDECDESVHSIERMMCPRAASFGQANKKRGGRWDTNLMEDSMPGLVSFCHGSFASEFNASSVVGDNDSVSSLECSLIHSGHSRQQAPNSQNNNTATMRGSTVEDSPAYSRSPRVLDRNILQPLARMEPDCKQQHQEVRWGGSSHRSSDAPPSLVRRPL